MKKIAFFTRDMNIGGMEKALVVLLNSLSIEKYDITLFLTEIQGVLLDDLSENIKIKKLFVSSSKFIILRKIKNYVWRSYWKLKYRNKFDFSCNYATYFTLGSHLALTASRNSLFYVHSDYYNLFEKDSSKIISFFNEQLMYKFSNIAFVSNESLNNIKPFFTDISEKMIVLNNVFDYKKVSEMSNETIDFKFPKGNNIIFVGRLENDSKDLKYLLKLANELKNDDVNFIIVGSGKDEAMCKKIIDDNKINNVYMVGEKKNPYPYLKGADALIITSNYEGNPLVFNEALLLEKKIITTVKVTDKYSKISEENSLFLEKDNAENKNLILNFLQQDIVSDKINFEAINKNRLNDIKKVIEKRG